MRHSIRKRNPKIS